MLEIKRISMRDRRRWKFIREKIESFTLRKALFESDGGHVLFAEVFGNGIKPDKTPGILDELDEAGNPTTERCVNHPLYQQAQKLWFDHQQKRRQSFAENRSL